jgi:hypothetical protein
MACLCCARTQSRNLDHTPRPAAARDEPDEADTPDLAGCCDREPVRSDAASVPGTLAMGQGVPCCAQRPAGASRSLGLTPKHRDLTHPRQKLSVDNLPVSANTDSPRPVTPISVRQPAHRSSTQTSTTHQAKRWIQAQALQEDRRRDSTARRHGWQVLRFSHDELINRPSTVADEVRSFLDPTPGT